MSTNGLAKTTDLLNTSHAKPKEKASKKKSEVKCHSPAICLIIIYIPLVIIPWVLTVILSYCPLFRSTYFYPEGFNTAEHKRMQSSVNAISVLNSIASLLAVPVVSFVIAQTAVVFSQKRESTRQLSVRDVFALADRAWTDFSVLFKLVRAKGSGSRDFNGFVALASGLLLVSALQSPLCQILVNWKSINIPSGILDEIPIDSTTSRLIQDKVSIGDDADPVVMAMTPHASILENVQFEFPSVRLSPSETYMWVDYNETHPPISELDPKYGESVNSLVNVRIRGESSDITHVVPAFFAALPFNVTTGTKRYHAMRFNSTLRCDFLPKDEFSTECIGNNPYTSSFEVSNDISSLELRICVPGARGTSPWTLSRNRQDIKEEVYLQLLNGSETGASSTVHCSSASTRGYFELDNYKTNGAYGRLLEHWPSPDVLRRNFNDKGIDCTLKDDISCRGPDSDVPLEWDTRIDKLEGWTPDKPEYLRWNASGPLVTSVMTLFGNDSWIRSAVNLSSTQATSNENASAPIWWKPFCERQPMYLATVEQCGPDETPGKIVTEWFANIFTGEYAIERLEELIFMGIILTNKAILLIHKESQVSGFKDVAGSRGIFSSSGFRVLKPNMALSSIIAISILLAIQIAGLVFCGIYIIRTPTWTRVFNAMAIARIGAGLEKDKLPVDGQYAEDEDYERLRSVELPLSMASASAIRRRAQGGA